MLRSPDKEDARPTAANGGTGHELRAGAHSEYTKSASLGYVIEVTTTDPDPRYRRRVYLSLHSATKALERAESRGHVCRLTLCELVPAGGEVE